MSNTDRIEKKVTLKAPPSRVWKAVADHREWAKWFGFEIAAPFVAGQPIHGTFVGDFNEAELVAYQQQLGLTPSGIKLPGKNFRFGTVERIEPERYFSFRWVPFGIDAEADETTTLVELRLEPVSAGTLLTIVESGFDQVPAKRRERAFRMNDGGWAQQAESLRKHVEV